MVTPTSLPETSHFPVMLEEIIKICSPKKGGIYVDCTFGGGGYSKEFLKYPETKVIALDRDEFILEDCNKLKKKYPTRFTFHQKKFSEINSVIERELADVVIFDLGLSSIQLMNLNRGFSFKSKGKLDMSMGLNSFSAEEVINNLSEKDIKLILKFFGNENEASKIAKNIVKHRKNQKITRVNELVEIIEISKRKNYKKKINPSTKTFQAIRMFVNKEISELIKGITGATKILKPGGLIIVLSFHSIEDKIVKFFFNNFSSSKPKPTRYLPENNSNKILLFEKYKNRIIKPSLKEIIKNPPSRSAKLRYAIRNKNKFVFPKELENKFENYLNLEKTDV